MKKIIPILILIAVIAGYTACTRSGPTDTGPAGGQKSEKIIDYYTCSMHPQIHQDHPGNCPICNMPLIPVYKETHDHGPTSSNIESTGDRPVAPTFAISPDRQQLIGVKTAVVEKKKLAREIRTTGRIAFDPELAVAIQEYLEVSQNVPDLKDAAVSRLKLLGMADEEIKQLNRRGGSRTAPTNLYLPTPKDSLWVYATLYENEMDLVKPGTSARIEISNVGANNYLPLQGVVRGVDRVVDPMTRSVRARIEIPRVGANNYLPLLRPDMFVTVVMEADLDESLSVPKSSVIDTGPRKIVFVKQGEGSFQMREIKTGAENRDAVAVTDGLKEGETVVTDATFLVDSESQLKTIAVSKPVCPEGEEWDVGMSMCMPKL